MSERADNYANPTGLAPTEGARAGSGMEATTPEKSRIFELEAYVAHLLAQNKTQLVDAAELRLELRKRKAEHLLDQEKYRALAQSARATAWQMDAATGIWTYVAPQAIDMFGYPVTQWYQKHFHARLVHPKDRGEFLASCEEAVSQDKGFALEYRLRHSQGHYLDVRNVVHVSTDVDGRKILHGILFDITQRLRMEADLATAQRLESVARLSTGVSQAITKPLRVLTDGCVFMRDALLDFQPKFWALQEGLRHLAQPQGAPLALPDFDHELTFVVEALPQTLSSWVESLNRVTKIARTMGELAPEDTSEKVLFDLNHVIETSIDRLREEYRGVAYIQFEPGPVPLVLGHASRIDVVLSNLIGNAAWAICEKGPSHPGHIWVRTNKTHEHAVIEVLDDGVGVNPSVVAKIFEPFVTTHLGNDAIGLGLTVAKAIVVDQHAGSLTFEGLAEGGTRFVVKLPAVVFNSLTPAEQLLSVPRRVRR